MMMRKIFSIAGTVLEDNLRSVHRELAEHPDDEAAKKRYMSASEDLKKLYLLQMEVYDFSIPRTSSGAPMTGYGLALTLSEASLATRKDVSSNLKEMARRGILTWDQVREREAGAIWATCFMKMHLAKLMDPAHQGGE